MTGSAQARARRLVNAGVVWSIDPAVAGCAIDTSPNPDLLSCDFASLAANASVVITISGETDAADCGTIHNLVDVSASIILVRAADATEADTAAGPARLTCSA